MKKIVSKTTALSIPGGVLLAVMAKTGLSGAAALTAALAAIGPGGMFGGILTLCMSSLASEEVIKYVMDHQ